MKRHNLVTVVDELMKTLRINDPIQKGEYRQEFTKILKKHRAFEGRCEICNHKLHIAESLERGIGPVCIKKNHRR